MPRSAEAPVLVLGSGISGLGAIRVLAAAGIPYLVLPDVDATMRRSRHYHDPLPGLAGATPQRLPEMLGQLPEGTVLLPCADAWALAIASLPPSLAGRYPASISSPETIATLVDKKRLGAVLARLELPHPRTIELPGRSSLDTVDPEIFQSAFLKPVDSQRFFARFRVKAFTVSGLADANAVLERCREAGLEMVLQEYVRGPASNHYFVDGFVDRSGTVSALFARQRLRMSPPDFGNSTLMRSVPLEQVGDAPNTLRRLLGHLGYRGIFSAEFKRDDRDGRYKLIEVNARVWWFVEFAARCGVDVCSMAVRDARGLPVAPLTAYALGRRCVYPYYDYDAAVVAWRRGELSLLEWARSWCGPTQPVFRWSDPLPAWGAVADALKRRLPWRRR